MCFVTVISWVSSLIFEPANDKTNKMACAPSEDRSAWASAQSDQSLRCPHVETLGPKLPIECSAKTLIRQGGYKGRQLHIYQSVQS